MTRIKFNNNSQRKFLQEVMKNINCPSLRELSNRLSINYSTLKNYFNEERLLSQSLFDDLCYISKIDKKDLEIKYLEDNWGQIKGGKKRKRKVSKF